MGTGGLLGVGKYFGVPKASGRESMILVDYIDHGRRSRAISMTKRLKLHCEREMGGHHHLKKAAGSQTPDGKIPNGPVTPDREATARIESLPVLNQWQFNY